MTIHRKLERRNFRYAESKIASFVWSGIAVASRCCSRVTRGRGRSAPCPQRSDLLAQLGELLGNLGIHIIICPTTRAPFAVFACSSNSALGRGSCVTGDQVHGSREQRAEAVYLGAQQGDFCGEDRGHGNTLGGGHARDLARVVDGKHVCVREDTQTVASLLSSTPKTTVQSGAAHGRRRRGVRDHHGE